MKGGRFLTRVGPPVGNGRVQFRRTAQADRMATGITERDRRHMDVFPVEQKLRIMRRIMSIAPLTEWTCDDGNGYPKVMLQVRARGLGLIDLQSQETAFTAIWYRKERTLLGRLKAEFVAMLVWEIGGKTGAVTTVRVWHL